MTAAVRGGGPLQLWGPEDRRRQMGDEVRRGLCAAPKSLPSKYFYDAHGSRLFERITRLPEYYLPRAEMEVLERIAASLVAEIAPDELVELGSGSSRKTRLLLEAIHQRGGGRYVPFDVSEQAIAVAAAVLERDYPWLEIEGVVGDFERHVPRIPRRGHGLVAFLGSTIGNFPPGPRGRFFADLASVLHPDDGLLVGFDLVKDVAVLEAAYNDSAGVTAEFNRNVLRVLNRELRADFDVEGFDHVAFYDGDNAWIEMRLRAREAAAVRLADLDLTIGFEAGEDVRTEISCKFTREGVARELADAGLELVRWETDARSRFALALAVPLSPEDRA